MCERRLRLWLSRSLVVIVVALLFWQGSYLAESRRNQAALQAAYELERLRTKLIVVSAPAAIILCGEDRRITLSNLAAEELFGWSHDELIGQEIDMLLPPSLQATHRASMQKAAAAVRAAEGDWLVRRQGLRVQGVHRDGHLIDLDLTVRVIKYEGRIEFIASMRPVVAPLPSRDVVPLEAIEAWSKPVAPEKG